MSHLLRRAGRLVLVGRGPSRPLWYVLDVLLAVALLVLDLPRVWTTYPGDEVAVWQPSALAVVLVVAQTLPIAVRRVAPVPVLAVTLGAVIAYGPLDGQPEPDYVSVCIAVYTVAADVPWQISRWCCGAALIMLPVALAQDLTVLGIFRTFLLIALVAALGLDRQRAIMDRARAAEERARQDAREQAIRVARGNLLQREQIARSLHDGLARSLTLMTVHGEALKAVSDRAAADRVERLLRSCREALTAVQGAVAALDRGRPGEQPPTAWEHLLADFRDAGLLIHPDPGLSQIPLGNAWGRCLHRVVHEGLTNALRHAGPGCSVRIESDVTPDHVSVRVISERGEEALPYRRAGAGFGLASLEQDVAALSGELEYGEVQQGWQVCARVPRGTVSAGASTARTGGSSATGRIAVVVVDDEAMIREGLRLLLSGHPDMEVVAEFSDGAGLLCYLGLDSDGGPDVDLDPGSEPPGDGAPVRWAAHGSARLVVLLDLVMPGLDGTAVLVALRDHPLRDRMRVLVLTTYGGQSSMGRALSLGADGYLLKDSTAQQLATALRAVAGGLTTLSPAAGARREPAPARRRLTARESEVLHLLGEGLSNRDIARRLGLTERTVKIHVSAVLGKLGVQSRTQAALMAWEEKPAAESTRDAT